VIQEGFGRGDGGVSQRIVWSDGSVLANDRFWEPSTEPKVLLETKKEYLTICLQREVAAWEACKRESLQP
jgi:hypothetical protein